MLLTDETLLRDGTVAASFAEWERDVEPRLRQALTASLGSQLGEDAAADALSFAWEQWDRVRAKENPFGYVYVVGRNKARRVTFWRRPVFLDVEEYHPPSVEPGVAAAVARLSEKQRIVVTLLYGYEWSMSEVAELLGTSKTTVQKHAERGLARLRKNLGVEL